MSSTRKLILAALVAAVLSGCDTAASYKAVHEERVKTMQDQLTILKEIKDEKGMGKARPELRKISWRFQSISKRFKALPALADGDKTELERTFQPALQSLVEQLQQEAQRINALPGGEEFLKTLQHL